MEMNNILKLIDAGFSADDIRAMMQPAADPEPAASADPEPAAPADPEPAAPAADAELTRIMQGLAQSVKDLEHTIKSNAARTSEFGTPKKETAEEILAQIIMPKNKGGN